MISKLEPIAVSVPEMATRLGISRSLAWRIVGEGVIRTVRIGKRVVVPTDAIDKFLAGSNPK